MKENPNPLKNHYNDKHTSRDITFQYTHVKKGKKMGLKKKRNNNYCSREGHSLMEKFF